MTVQLDHTIVLARDNEASARFLAEMLGLPEPTRVGPFFAVPTANGVALDFMQAEGRVTPQHYAFRISETEFDQVFDRIQRRQLPYWADPARARPNQIRQTNGSRGLYFEDPTGHFLEVLT